MNRKLEQVISVILGIFTLGFLTYVEAGTHHEMTEGDECVKRLKRASYKEFKEKIKSERVPVKGDWYIEKLVYES